MLKSKKNIGIIFFWVTTVITNGEQLKMNLILNRGDFVIVKEKTEYVVYLIAGIVSLEPRTLIKGDDGKAISISTKKLYDSQPYVTFKGDYVLFSQVVSSNLKSFAEVKASIPKIETKESKLYSLMQYKLFKAKKIIQIVKGKQTLNTKEGTAEK